MTLARIIGFRLVTADVDRLARFYAGLGFAIGDRAPIADDEMRLLGLAATGERLATRLGPTSVEIDRFDPPGRPYPADTTAADLVFQHLALVTDDAAAAWAQAKAAGAQAISRERPVTLPASSGGVTAVKFRDPDGHPLEFLQFPPGANADWTGSGIQGVDHSAVTVADIGASRDFFADLGLTNGHATLNEGPAQVALDGLDGVVADVVPMKPGTTPPHLELLGYRTPRGRSQAPLHANDIAATRIVWQAGRDALIRDPDGHIHQLTR